MSAEERHGDLVEDGSLLDWFRTMVAEAASRGENAYRLLSERALGDVAPEMQGLYEEAHRTLRRGEALLPATVWALLERGAVLFDERMPPIGLEAQWAARLTSWFRGSGTACAPTERWWRCGGRARWSWARSRFSAGCCGRWCAPRSC